ncbi:hypothetical protein C2S53_005970 [Perilla frutescens var. hirtella]|uniref:U-box domain-containing protein n=1 Tax=Perilla frutescens var. hirtella TaxID=608512 RepID=A0AAD4J2M2_PERFH|nr:hypothetical protein C2S53_005970 [Perilla frutescens var. hirtella]
MVRDDLCITVPTYFRCPISLDVMKSPVSLCTGVTYDRSSIQRWLDGGNNTCPATMQVLHSRELIPNHTLQRLIKIWSDSVLTRPSNSSPPLTREDAAQLVRHLDADLRNHHRHFLRYSSLIAQNLSALTSFAAVSEENGAFMAATGGGILPMLVSIIGRVKDLSFLEKIVIFCNILLKNLAKVDSEAMKSRIEIENFDFKSSILMGLKQGRPELRIAVAKFLELLAANICIEINSCSISEDDEFHHELLRLLMMNSDVEAANAALSLLIRLAELKRNRAKMVRAGGVTVLAAALAEAEMSSDSTEKVLRLLEMVTGSKEGRNEICADENCVPAVVKKVLKVSSVATEHAVAVLWSLCCLFDDKRAAAAAVASNGMAKILVVMQSDCSSTVRRRCGDLLRVFRCSSKSSCVSWYDTKTTHIMPF